MTTNRRRKGALAPNPDLWAALRDGELLTEILDEFYTRVFADPQLSPFFEGVTKDWVRRKQYNFLRSIFTGEKIYFGNRPRNAHHWMVISHELFDRREQLMEQCLRRAGLPAHLIERWMACEEVYRGQIVKDAPVPRKVSGVALPLEGHEPLVLQVGSLCSACEEPVDAGTKAWGHVRTGTLHCPACMSRAATP